MAKATKIKRAELYRRVWDTPVDTLAKEFGISGRGLKKICDKLDIPTPPRGYWAKLNAGKSVKQIPLPPQAETIREDVAIYPTPEPVAPEPPKPVPEHVQQQIEQDLSALPAELSPPKTLHSPHWLVGRWLDEDKRQQREYRRDPWGYKADPIDGTEIGKRKLKVMSAIFKEWERLGHEVKPEGYGQHQLYLQIRKQKMEFQCFEYLRQFRRPLTDQEKRESFRSNQKWRQEKEPTGKLIIRIKTNAFIKQQTEWRDEDDTVLEDRLAEIIGGFIKIGAFLEEKERERMEEERRRREVEHQRYEEERVRKRDAARFKHVRRLAAQANEAGLVRQFLNSLEDQARTSELSGELPTELLEWLTWARKKTDAFDPLSHQLSALVAENEQVNEWTYKDI